MLFLDFPQKKKCFKIPNKTKVKPDTNNKRKIDAFNHVSFANYPPWLLRFYPFFMCWLSSRIETSQKYLFNSNSFV